MATDKTVQAHGLVPEDYGVQRVREALHDTLRSYIEAQYHIRDEGLIRERAALLREVGSIAQRPYVEATPIYQPGASYAKLAIPAPAKQLLVELAGIRGAGIFDPPFTHQADALEAFLGRGEDLDENLHPSLTLPARQDRLTPRASRSRRA